MAKLEKEQQVKAPNIRAIVSKALEEKILSLNKEEKKYTDKELSEACYDFVVNMLSTFMVHTRLQSRILHETRALEKGFQNANLDPNQFEVTVIARPKSAIADKVVQETINAERATSSGEDRSEVETDSTSTEVHSPSSKVSG